MESQHSKHRQLGGASHGMFHDRTVVLPQGKAAFDALCQSLENHDPEVRAAAAQELQAHPGAATAPLCAALNDPDERVRISAAESLGQLGDPDAIAPLTHALRQSLVGGSGQRQLMAGLLLILIVVVLVGGYLWGALVWRMGGVMVISNVSARSVNRLARRRRARSEICRTISHALARIAEQHPSPQLREVIPELRALAADRIHHDQGARQASREAADRIDTVTERLKSLPVSSSSAPVDGKSLPLASGNPADVTPVTPPNEE